MNSFLLKLKQCHGIFTLTRRHLRASTVKNCEQFYINGVARSLWGEDRLSMLLDIVFQDTYGIKQCADLAKVIDVGANIGIFCLHIHTLFPKAKIFALEPSAENREFLNRNVSDFATVYPYAISDSDGFANLAHEGGHTAFRLSNSSTHATVESVRTISLESLLSEIDGDVDLLKTDCEGGEYAIFRSPALRRVRRIVGEMHTCEAGTPEEGLVQLRAQGFAVEKWQPFEDGKAGIVWARQEKNT